MIKKIILLLILLGLVFAGWFVYNLMSNNGQEQNKTFLVSQGEGASQISYSLAREDLIKSQWVFETWLWLQDLEEKIVAGVYNIPANISARELTNILIVGPKNDQRALTIVEGFDRNMIAARLDKNEFSGEEFLTLSQSAEQWSESYDFLVGVPTQASLEGFLFPDTYYVDDKTTENNIIIKALNNFNRKLTTDLRAEVESQEMSLFEVVTLASIIEREVPEFADKQMIADIFLKRLEEGIGLQSDATVNFITGKGLLQPSYEDTRIDSPYNTYKYRGLPPGPIANPGIDSIEAVLYPTSNAYFYFLTTPEGEVIYSETYDEHLENKARYLD